jgi:hypothetical protein
VNQKIINGGGTAQLSLSLSIASANMSLVQTSCLQDAGQKCYLTASDHRLKKYAEIELISDMAPRLLRTSTTAIS